MQFARLLSFSQVVSVRGLMFSQAIDRTWACLCSEAFLSIPWLLGACGTGIYELGQ